MHTCYLLSQTTKVRQSLSSFKIFTIVLSGLCHDVGHTGFTNLFEIASQSKKAILYNDSSVNSMLFSLFKITMHLILSNFYENLKITSCKICPKKKTKPLGNTSSLIFYIQTSKNIFLY